MNDLLQSQIRDSCRLGLPEGLQELMSDISREVLRYQPENLYQFIANYLEALLTARQALSIACRICGELSHCSCEPQLDEELYRIGLSEDDVAKAKNLILDHFDKGQVQETNLLIELATKTNASGTQLVELQKAIHKAFQRSAVMNQVKDIQLSFENFERINTESSQEPPARSVSTQSSASDFYKPDLSPDTISTDEMQASPLFSTCSFPIVKTSVSAATLAGSFVDLPHKIPYSVHNSECQNILIKSEKSVLKLLKSYLFTESRQPNFFDASERNLNTFQLNDFKEGRHTISEELDEAIKSIFRLDINENRSKISMESQNRAIFKAIDENIDDSSSGGS